jgi:phosphatidate phosphatase APP1
MRVAHLIHRVELAYDRVKYRSGTSWRKRENLIIYPYLGYGSPRFIYLKGRVLEDKGITPARETDSVWVNLRNMYRRFESDEVPYARVLARCEGREQACQADEEGFFEVALELADPLTPDHSWLEVDLELLEPGGVHATVRLEPLRARGRAMMVSPLAAFGVVSDVDDTVVHTGATSVVKMAGTVFLRNAHTRLPLDGVAEFYRALQAGSQTGVANPLFYVSSSPWNLYDLFEQFFRIHGLPDGPLILRDWGFERDSLLSIRHTRFKLAAIRRILDAYPDLPFILLGDSGEEDPEIYAEVMRHYPGRILSAYIRDVNSSTSRRRTGIRRRESVQLLVKEAEGLGSAMLLAPDTPTMARHAKEHGWINH